MLRSYSDPQRVSPRSLLFLPDNIYYLLLDSVVRESDLVNFPSYVVDPIDRDQGVRHGKDDAKRLRAALDNALAWKNIMVCTHKSCVEIT